MKRRFLTTVAGCALALGAGVVTVGPFSAATPGVASCAFNGSGSVSPPVTYKSQSVTYTFSGKLTCGSSDTKVKGGTLSASGSGTISCLTGNHTASMSVTWSNGRTSSMSVHYTDATVELAGTGAVSSGEFAGDKVASDLAFYSTQGTKCATTGLGSASLSGVFELY